MKNKKTFLALMLLTMATDLFAQDYPSLRDIGVVPAVSFDQSNKMFFYSYTLTNESSNKGDLWIFDIDISILQNSLLYDTTGLRFNSSFIEGHFRRRYPALDGKVVPVGVPRLPRFWSALYGNDLMVSLSADTLLLRPGETVSALVVMSRGLPGIRKFVVRPDFNEDLLFPNIEDTTSTLTFAQMDSIREAGNFYGMTVGPSAPPMSFSPLAWVDTLISYKHRAFALGWIKNQGIVQSLDAKLENAKAQLQRGNKTSARNILQTVINEVEALNDQGNQLTSEAYALLKYNAEFLLSKL
ncbi:MAG: hypothetical protein WEB62_10335 [Bacteroidota bacterium]